MARAQAEIERLLAEADVQVNGSRPWDTRVSHPAFYARVLAHGSIGLGMSYVEGWWDVPQLDEMFARILHARLDERVRRDWRIRAEAAVARLTNPQAASVAPSNVRRHYDLGNDLFRAMLDPRLVYTCAYWRDAHTLDEAQDAKLELVCRKIGVRSGQVVLDVGCGWGSWARFAAERHGARVVGVTLSPAQLELGRTLCTGLPVELRLQDYREIGGTFDHVVSLGMFEHVGVKNYRRYMQCMHDRLQDDGLFLLQTIGGNDSVSMNDPWLHKVIFPNSVVPSAQQIARASEGLFVIEDWENFGLDYDRTLCAWWENCERNWGRLNGKYDESFRRAWKYYLLTSAGSFRARRTQVWQILFSKHGVQGGFRRGH